MSGSAGKYISMDNGPTATMSPSIIIHKTGKSAERTRLEGLGGVGELGDDWFKAGINQTTFLEKNKGLTQVIFEKR